MKSPVIEQNVKDVRNEVEETQPQPQIQSPLPLPVPLVETQPQTVVNEPIESNNNTTENVVDNVMDAR